VCIKLIKNCLDVGDELVRKEGSLEGKTEKNEQNQIDFSFAGFGRNVGRVRNPLPFSGVIDASGFQTIKIIKRAHL
jgi:hypothetical protein